MSDITKYIDGFFGLGSKASTDFFQRDLLERLLSYEVQILTEPQKAQARENIGVLNIEKFIELSDTENYYSDGYALIGDELNNKISYSKTHGANDGFFWVEKVCPEPSWSANILINGDFSSGNEGWSVPAGWSTVGGSAAHSSGEVGALTQVLDGSATEITCKVSLGINITYGQLTISIHDLSTGNQVGEAYEYTAYHNGNRFAVFTLDAKTGYQLRFTPSSDMVGEIDNIIFQIGDVGSNASPQIRGYDLNKGQASLFEVAWKGGGLYIGRNCGWETAISENSNNLIISPDGFTELTGGYNITAFGHGQGEGVKNQHDLILIGSGLTTDKSHNLKIGIAEGVIIEGDMLTLDLFFGGNVEVDKNLTLFSGNSNYSYVFPDFVPLTVGQIMQVGSSSPSAFLKWSPYTLPVSLPESDSVILISDDGTSSYATLHPPVTIAAGSTDYLSLSEGGQELSIDLSGFLTDQFWQLQESNWHYLPTNRAEIRPVSAQPETWIKNYTGTEWDDIALVGKFAGSFGRRWEVLFKDLSPQQTWGDISILNVEWDIVPRIQVNSVIDARNALWFRYGDTGTQYTIFNFLHQITNLEVYAQTGETATCRTRFYQNGDFGIKGKLRLSTDGSTYNEVLLNQLLTGSVQAATLGHVLTITDAGGGVKTVSWAAVAASVPGTETLSGTSVTLKWNGTTTAIYAMTADSTLTIGSTANYVKRVKVTGDYALTLSGATVAAGTYDGAKVNLIDFVPVDGVVYAFITNI